MVTRMLIDARHPEETRVAVVRGNRIEEFDFEAAARRQIKGNIYLAKVTRVEPSLQAAFVDYGGNRHGFLAFSEIHPDYYQIPREDREALLREEQQLAEESAAQEDRVNETVAQDNGDNEGDDGDDGSVDDASGDTNGDAETHGNEEERSPEEHGNNEEASAEALRRKRLALRRRYKIQEVIRRRQVMLVQVVKEERGNKGAALTTYISLAGRYSVLMPNTAHGGGISRKIANVADRKRLKAIMADLNLPESMGAIVRTAGLERTRTEIRRDFDYLARLWDEIRERTMVSTAPALIYEDSDLIKRAIRDIYSRDVDEVLVDGEEGYRQAKNFMKLLMPSHAKKVQIYSDAVPLFQRAGVEAQLAALLNPVVTLRSGGYIVINPTEALVAIDVNSGRSTREYNIEETALKTNIEAAEEVARQLRLRDLAGLVVVDFIDMELNSNNRKVERSLKEALKHDRARIQVGRISAFGLLEMSRQRLRTGVLEASTETCRTCEGLGLVRTPASAALAALRLLEEEAVKGRASQFRLRTDESVAIYMLNRKRGELTELEVRYGIVVEIVPDTEIIGGRVTIDSSGPPPAEPPRAIALAAPATFEDLEMDDAEEEEDYPADTTETAREGGRRRRRRGRRGRDRDQSEDRETTNGNDDPTADADASGEATEAGETSADQEHEENGNGERKRRRPRRRRGRRDGGEQPQSDATDREQTPAEGETPTAEAATAAQTEVVDAPAEEPVEAAVETVTAETVEETPAAAEAAPAVPEKPVEETVEEQPAKPKPRRTTRRKTAATKEATAEAAADEVGSAEAGAAPAPAEEEPVAAEAAKPVRRTRRKKAETAEETAESAPAEAPEKPAPKPRARRTTRKPAAAKEPAEEPATAAPDAGPASADAPVPVPADAVPAAETVADGNSVADAAPAKADPGDTATADTGESGDADAPASPRRGWWQRTFGN